MWTGSGKEDSKNLWNIGGWRRWKFHGISRVLKWKGLRTVITLHIITPTIQWQYIPLQSTTSNCHTLPLPCITIHWHARVQACTHGRTYPSIHPSIHPSMHACMHRYLEFRIMMHPIWFYRCQHVQRIHTIFLWYCIIPDTWENIEAHGLHFWGPCRNVDVWCHRGFTLVSLQVVSIYWLSSDRWYTPVIKHGLHFLAT